MKGMRVCHFSNFCRSEDEIINDRGRKLVSFCEILKLEILNGNREGD
jgi:hypothetical protein